MGAPGSGRPGWPEGAVARPIEKDDVEAWVALLAAAERVDDAGENFDADDLMDELADPAVNAETDTIGLWSGDRMIGYGMVRGFPNAREVDRIRGEGTIHPDWRRRGLGRRVLDWLAWRAGELHAARYPGLPGEVSTWGLSTNAGFIATAERAGFAPVRYYFGMERDLPGEKVPPVEVPDGLRLVPFEASLNEATRLAHNEAFLDHWGFEERDKDFWRTWGTGSRAFRPAVSFLLVEADRPDSVASYILGYEYEADTAATGVRDCFVGQVGTRRPWRGRGAARFLLARTLTAAHDIGFHRASLAVDSENPSGALGLYERLGFRVRRQLDTYARPLD